jgi:hypothetical protein
MICYFLDVKFGEQTFSAVSSLVRTGPRTECGHFQVVPHGEPTKKVTLLKSSSQAVSGSLVWLRGGDIG